MSRAKQSEEPGGARQAHYLRKLPLPAEEAGQLSRQIVPSSVVPHSSSSSGRQSSIGEAAHHLARFHVTDAEIYRLKARPARLALRKRQALV